MSWKTKAWMALSVLSFAGGSHLYAPLAAQTAARIAEDDLLDVGIQVLDPGTKKKSFLLTGYEYINPELRQSEAAFIAVHLMHTLQKTESFGLVRMMPRNSVTADLYVTGRIKESSGRRLKLELEVRDAAGRRWLKKSYGLKARPMSHALSYHSNIEPFQELYDEFSTDLVAAQGRTKGDYLENLRWVADLRFAAQLAPGVFGDYLARNVKGRVELDRLPSRDDPMLARVRTIRTRDEFFLDLLTDRYQGFYASMDRSYDNFRATRFEVEVALRDARAQATIANATAMLGPPDESGFHRRQAVQRANFFRRRVAVQAEFLDEISKAFATEMDPLNLELAGEVIRFEGTIEDQYRQWQELLERIFERETGMSAKTGAFVDDLNTRH